MRGQLRLKLLRRVAESRRAVLEQVGEPEVVMDAREARVERGGLLELLDGLREEIPSRDRRARRARGAAGGRRAARACGRKSAPRVREAGAASGRRARACRPRRNPSGASASAASSSRAARSNSPEHEVGLPEHVARGRARGVARERSGERLGGLLVLPRVEVGDGEPDEHLRRVGPVRGGRLQRRDRAAVVRLRRVDSSRAPGRPRRGSAAYSASAAADVARAPVRLSRLVMFAE